CPAHRAARRAVHLDCRPPGVAGLRLNPERGTLEPGTVPSVSLFMRVLAIAIGFAAVVASSACVISVDANAYIERSEQRFEAPSVVELHLTTFDGSIEVRTWDRPEVLVTVEKRGQTKGAVSHIDVRSDRKDRRIDVEATHQGSRGVSLGLTAPSVK